MIHGLLGRKLGMLQRFEPNGTVAAVTAIEAGPCHVTQIRTKEKDGYEAVQLGFGQVKRLNQPERGHLKAVGESLKHLHEFKVDDLGEVEIGQRIGADLFQVGDFVDVTAVSKGRGFAGVVRRHGFHGGPKTHGQSDRHRSPGSIGSTTTPGRVLKGLRMAGQMGSKQVTVRGLRIVDVNPDRGLLLLQGGVPGPRTGLVTIRRSTRRK
ncbi:MAG TPA: 50S ribosomal protein L3 [Dehalococcoidia bacterium]|nr:50S ribosomal protein L3 [Dehalococcoidia bacterium]